MYCNYHPTRIDSVGPRRLLDLRAVTSPPDTGGPIPALTRCALCRTVIAPTSPKRVVDGDSYHAGCWDRKVRQDAEKKQPPRC